MSQTQTHSIQVIPRAFSEEGDVIDQLFAFAIYILNNGDKPVKIKEIGLMQPRSIKKPLNGAFLQGITALPSQLEPHGQFHAIFYPELDGRDLYTSAYVEMDDGTIIEGKSYDLTLLSEI